MESRLVGIRASLQTGWIHPIRAGLETYSNIIRALPNEQRAIPIHAIRWYHSHRMFEIRQPLEHAGQLVRRVVSNAPIGSVPELAKGDGL